MVRGSAVGALVVLCTALGGWLQVSAAAAAGPAAHVAVTLAPASIVDSGTAKSTATVTVTDASNALVSGDTIVFSAAPSGLKFSAVKKGGKGIYTTTITGSTALASFTITATDTSVMPNVLGQAELAETAPPPPPPPLPAKNVSVVLSPASIVANGSSTSTATATVTNANGGRVAGDTIAFSTNDGGDGVSATTDRGNGVYTATITSSKTVHGVTITATDRSVSISGNATLTQTAPRATTPPPPAPGTPSATKLSSVPTAPVTNQPVTLIATVTSSTGTTPTGAITFQNRGAPIGGCANQPVTPQAPIVACVTAFSASTSPELLTAVFTPTAGSGVAGSTSANDSLVVGRDSTATTLSVPSGGIVKVGADITYSATVTSAHGGAFETGSVGFEDAGTPIPACAGQPLGAGGTATCTVSYAATGTHAITAVYHGDANFSGSTSTPAQAVGVVKASVKVLGIIGSTMQWTFFYTPSYTKVLALAVNSAPVGATVVLQCKGGGCPFAKRSMPVPKPKPCKKTSKHKCPPKRSVTIHLMPRFHNHHLRVGAQIMVRVVRSHWIGKYYAFVMRARRAPKVQVECLAPGSSRPGVGC
jgi:adhesin/invasin